LRTVVIGGTGTLGTTIIDSLYGSASQDLVVFSRDELKQQQMKAKYPGVTYVIGDVRDQASVRDAVRGADRVFLVAALKHVDVIEDNPVEAVKTNIIGTINVAEACYAARVQNVVFSSTDKAVLPINTYGMTKGISERYLLGLNSRQMAPRFAVYRWGNVIGSRGSVIHSFADTLRKQGKVFITDPCMTRFWIHIEEAVAFMLSTWREAYFDRVMIPEMRAAKVIDLAEATARALGISNYGIEVVGIRPGEKIHECLESNHDYCVRSDTCNQYSIDELEAMARRVLR
jgi:FlaA1/EpsC-like NDP-sugar epimerase